MLDRHKFQQIIKNFYDIPNRDRISRLCRTIYERTYYLTLAQLENVLDQCVVESTYQYITPKQIGLMANRVYPFDQSDISKQKKKLNKIEESKMTENECFRCLNTGYIKARYRRPDIDGHYESTFLCICEIGQSISINCQTWNKDLLEQLEPEYEKIYKSPKIESLKDLLPESRNINKTNINTLQEEIKKSISL